MTTMHRVFVATTKFDRLDYWLHHPRSLEGLEAMGDALCPGARVMLVGPAGQEQPARLEHQEEVNCWVAYPSLGTAD